MASSCSSVNLPLKCSISGKTIYSISSSVGLSGKFEQLESPSSVSDLSEFTRPDEYFIFFKSSQDTNLVPMIGTIKNLILFYIFSHFISSFHG